MGRETEEARVMVSEGRRTRVMIQTDGEMILQEEKASP
jgi:hypothetical protein